MTTSERTETDVSSGPGFTMSEEFVRLLRERVASSYYNQPHVVDVIARAILISRGLYPPG